MIMQLDINIEHISNKKGEIGLIKQKAEVLFWFFHSQ